MSFDIGEYEEGLVYDIETNGYMDVADKITCIVIQDIQTEEVTQYYEDEWEIEEALVRLLEAPLIVAHNQIGADIPFIKKWHSGWTEPRIRDTYIHSLLLFPERSRHSIASYAKDSEFSKVDIDDFSCLTYSILDRCTLDVILNTQIYKMMWDKELHTGQWDSAIDLEQYIYTVHQEQLNKGVLVDQYKVNDNILSLDFELDSLKWGILKDAPKTLVKEGTINKVFKKNGDYMPYVSKFIGGV